MERDDDGDRKRIEELERQSDKRTAAFVVRSLDEAREQLADLIPDINTFDHFAEADDLSWIVRRLEAVRDKYQAFVDTGEWEPK